MFLSSPHPRKLYLISGGPRIFPRGCANSQIRIILQFFAENCVKMKEFGPPGDVLLPPGSATVLYRETVLCCLGNRMPSLEFVSVSTWVSQ